MINNLEDLLISLNQGWPAGTTHVERDREILVNLDGYDFKIERLLLEEGEPIRFCLET